MMETVQVVWFKRDLRVSDHRPLATAAIQGPVVPLYVVEPDYWRLPDSSRRHWHFIHDSLTELDAELAACGTPLIVRVGGVMDALEALRAQLGSFVLWSHEETGNHWTYMRDIAVQGWCRAHGITWNELPSAGVVRRLESRDGWSKIRDARMAEPIVEPPCGMRTLAAVAGDALPDKASPLFGSHAIGTVQQGGRRDGLKTLESFLDTRGKRYMATISKPGVSARHCSRLSAHIAFGTLSVREVEQRTKQAMQLWKEKGGADAAIMRRNLSAFLSRLAWRCHFVQKLEQQPDIEFQCMHPAFEGMREPHHREDFFDAWKQGMTGYPLVDACMRSLHANGWITFRMRAMLVSFASYHLWLDWRQTAPFLATLFTDYEPGIHYAQFQMQSGVTGINAVRMYNPVKQSLDHDPEGKFIRRYVPELKNVPDAWIHEPWRMETPSETYPLPIVDHDAAIRHARSEIGARWKSEGFRDASRAVNQKLGSRNKQPNRTRRVDKKPVQQLTLDL
jgi:deoxyribodipyrimidine photo-lyase